MTSVCYNLWEVQKYVEKEARRERRCRKEKRREKEKDKRCEASKEQNKNGQKKLFNNDQNTNQICEICKKNTKPANEIRCDQCKKFYHRKCVPHFHKMHVPEETDNFLCHCCYKEQDSNNSLNLDLDETSDDGSTDELYTLVTQTDA